MARLQTFRAQVVRALKTAGLYTRSLTIQINNLASALMTLAIANDEIEGLSSVLLTNETSQGVTYIVHPVFRIQRDAMEQVTKQMKQLGLTTADVVGKPDVPDAGDELLEKISAIR